jgi:hypothetical protein
VVGGGPKTADIRGKHMKREYDFQRRSVGR